jgi:predicted ATPase/DNA-binding SARP family transcriptional activator
VVGLNFRVLGPLEVRWGESLVTMRGSDLNLLAALLMSANRAVSVDSLTEMVWGERLPMHPRAALQNRISRLRALMGDQIFQTSPGGYQVNAGIDELDLLQFNRLLAEASKAPDDVSVASLEQALSLWRGSPFSNVDSPALHRELVPQLIERYLAACEEWAELCLRLDRGSAIVEKISVLVSAHPFRERLIGQLMRALCHGDRRAEALSVYDKVRRSLREELGVDPSPTLQKLHLEILHASSAVRARLEGPPGSPPRWVGRGPAPGGLTGRDADVSELAEAIRERRTVTLVGTAGVGKTALALQTAGQLAPEFGAGVVVVELGGLPVQQDRDLHTLTEAALGVLELTTDAHHSLHGMLLRELAPQQLLLVLDNAEHVASACAHLIDLITRSCPQVRVLTTSRRPVGLNDERVLRLAPLNPAAAQALLRQRAADHGIDISRYAAETAELCGLLERLPLAIELAAARLRTMTLPALLERVTGSPGLLANSYGAALPHQLAMSKTLQWSHDLLTEPARTLLNRLALLTDPFQLEDAEQACSYTPLHKNDIAGLLTELIDNSLVQAAPVEDTYRYHLPAPIRDFAIRSTQDSITLCAKPIGTER